MDSEHAQTKGSRKEARISVNFDEHGCYALSAVARSNEITVARAVHHVVADLIGREHEMAEGPDLLSPRLAPHQNRTAERP